MARPSTGNRRGVGSRIGWPLKIFVGALLVILILLVLNAFALNNETKSAELNVRGAQLVSTTEGQLQVLDTGPPLSEQIANAPGMPGDPSAVPPTMPIVLIHGSAGAINWWEDLIPLLKPKYRVIAIDLLGYGGSDKPESDYSIETQANLVAQVLGKLDVSRAVLVGHSLGGSVVTSVAEQSPDLVSGIVLIDSGPDSSYGGLSGAAKASRTPVLGQALWRLAPDSMIRKNVSQGFAPGYDVPDKFVQDVRNMTYPAYKKSSEGVEDYTDEKSLPDRLAELGKPVLVIFGEEDQIYDAREALSAYAAVPGAKTHLILDSGHSPQVEQPAQTNTQIAIFVSRLAWLEGADERKAAAAAAAKKRAAAAKKKTSNKARAKVNQSKKSPGKKADQPKKQTRQLKQQARQRALNAQKEAAQSKVESP